MVEVSPLQYYHGVPDMPVQKIHPHFCPCCCPPPTPLDWAFPPSPPRLINPSYMSEAIRLGAESTNDFYLLLPPHDVSSDAPPATPPLFTHYTPNTSLWPSFSPGILTPLPSSTALTPSPTGSLLPVRGGITSRPYSRCFSASPLYQIDRSGCQKPPASSAGLLMRPGHHPRKKRRRGFAPLFRNRHALPLSLTPTRLSVLPLRQPPH